MRATGAMFLLPAFARAWLPWARSYDGSTYCTVQRDPCTPQAFVRAQDLAPHTVARGELRVRLPEGCKDRIAGVTLSLTLEEYCHVRLPRTSARIRWDSWVGGHTSMPTGKYETTTRTVWTAEASLTQDVSEKEQKDLVRAFSVVSPNVNYPPATLSETHSTHENDYEAYLQTWTAYRYVARVTLSSGKLHDIVAGFTAFHPTNQNATTEEEVTVEIVARPLKEPSGPWDPPSHFPVPQSVGKSLDNASMTLQVSFPRGAHVVAGGPLPLRIRVVAHTIPADLLLLGATSLSVVLQVGATFTPSRAGFTPSPAPMALRALPAPSEPYRPPAPPALVALALDGTWAKARLDAPADAPADAALAFGTLAGTVLIGAQLPPTWRDADDGWSVARASGEAGMQALVPVRILSSATPPAAAVAPADAGTPLLVPGHRPVSVPAFPRAEPREATTTTTETDGYERVLPPWERWDDRQRERECGLGHGDEFYGPELGLVERTYAGMLWVRRYGADSGMPARLGDARQEGLVVQQTE